MKRNLTVAAWNVRTMLDRSNSTDRPARRTALIAQELQRYDIDIAALSETRLAGEGAITEDMGGYSFFWKGYPPEENRIHGVAFAIRSSLLRSCPENPVGISARLMKLRIPLTNSRYATFFSCYAPTLVSSEEDKDLFYNCLDEEIRQVCRTDKLFVLGDLNARVGRDNLAWSGVMGGHGMGKMNSNGHRLLSFCAQNELFVTNTGFQLREIHKGTWTHPRSKHCHMIDYCITRQRDRQDVLITRVMRGADCWTDHYLLRSKLSLRIRPPVSRRAAKKKLNCILLTNDNIARQEYKEVLFNRLSDVPPAGIEPGWKHFTESVNSAATDTIGFASRKNKDWFDANLPGIQELLECKHRAHSALLSNPSSVRLRDIWKQARSSAERALRGMENSWWLRLASEIQGYADSGDLHNFYDALKRVYGPTDRSLAPVRSQDGTTLYTGKNEIMARWKEHYSTLLNTRNPSVPNCLESIPSHPTISELSSAPTLQEVTNAINNLKNNKSPGGDGIPAELLKYGGQTLNGRLHELIQDMWREEEVPQQWKDAKIVSIYKRKGDRATCGNSRGISLLAVAGKVLSRVLLARLNQHIVDRVCPESQCGFRKERGTTDMIFVARQLQEKCREQQRNLCMAFIDLSKAFDTVDRSMLWMVLAKFGCPEKFVNMIKAFHTDMMATVCVAGEESEAFGVAVGVKQGCAMAPVLFIIYLAAASILFYQRIENECGVSLTYRLDGSLFNLQRLKARTKVSPETIYELQYADDCALVAHTPENLQRSLDVLHQVYTSMGLVINANKTEILYQWYEPPAQEPVIVVEGSPLKVTNQFPYLGAVLSADSVADVEVNNRINKASAAFARIRERVISSHNLRLTTKAAVYKAICLSVLLYGIETITVYARHLKLLERFHMRCVKEILGLTWRDKVTHTEMLRRVGLQSIECLIARNQLRWAGHIRRMPVERYPRRVLYGQLAEGHRPAHGPKKRYKDRLKKTIRDFGMLPDNFESEADDRAGWRAACSQGASYFEEERSRLREAKRARRREPRENHSLGDQNWVCHCGRRCKSRIGLFSHQRTHRTGQDGQRQVISDIAGQP